MTGSSKEKSAKKIKNDSDGSSLKSQTSDCMARSQSASLVQAKHEQEDLNITVKLLRHDTGIQTSIQY